MSDDPETTSPPGPRLATALTPSGRLVLETDGEAGPPLSPGLAKRLGADAESASAPLLERLAGEAPETPLPCVAPPR